MYILSLYNMKITRLGMTESGLLLLFFVYNHVNVPPNIKQQVVRSMMQLANWLYTTSGYYDSSVNGTKFNFDMSCLNAVNFQKYMGHLATAASGCEQSQFYFHEGFIMNLYKQVKTQFQQFYNIQNFVLLNDPDGPDLGRFIDRVPIIFEKIRDKRVLVVSSFTGLVKQQYESGNIYKLGIDFPTVKHVDGVTTPYCFLNQGPHKDYFETLESIFEDIKQKDFDIALLGCGAYGHMLTHKIHADLGKDAFYIGGCVTNIFGILSTRERTVGMGKHVQTNEYWILDIPESYRPSNFKDIEDGCYW